MYIVLRIAVISLALFSASSALADHPGLEEVLIRAQKPSAQAIDFDFQLKVDSAQLLQNVPGANVSVNGPISSMAQYRGLYGERVQTTVNGMTIASAGPNFMDAPLSYAPGLILQSMTVYRGAAPVGAAQESIGGLIEAQTWQPVFSQNQEAKFAARAIAGVASVERSKQGAVGFDIVTQQHAFLISVLDEQADNVEFPEGEILPSEYERKRYDMAYGFKQGAHKFQLHSSKNETGVAGTAALPMDIVFIDGELIGLVYNYDAAHYSLGIKTYGQDLRHLMTNYQLRQAPVSMTRWRANMVDSKNRGVVLSLSTDHWKAGVDWSQKHHNSDITNPNSATFFVRNFNRAEKTISGLFVEYKNMIARRWVYDLGFRFNHIDMNAGLVNGSPAMMMPAAGLLRDRFNQSERKQSDNTIDWTAKLYYRSSESLQYYLGLSRKSRSASYQQKFLWLPLQASGGLADGRNYTGRVDLKPEVAHEIDIGFDWQASDVNFVPRIFYRQVDDYIQGTASTNMPAVMVSNMMSGMSSLEFNNIDAFLYGFDWQTSYQLNRQWKLGNVSSFVRGKRGDINDNLYRIAPFNTRVQLIYQRHNLRLQTELAAYARQSKVSRINNEQQTEASTILNAAADWHVSDNLRLVAGIENIMDKNYSLHLNGINRVAGNADIAIGERLPEAGRNVYLKAQLQW